jgi:hypothetical protein
MPGGIGIISLNPDLIDRAMDNNMKEVHCTHPCFMANYFQLLSYNGFKFDTDYRSISREEAIQLLSVILGVDPTHRVNEVQRNYVLTFDNLMKMISVQLRVKSDIPAVIMGETGCGKFYYF